MIPPLKESRLRSINRWMSPKTSSEDLSAEQSSRASELDDRMVEAFEEREDALKRQMMDNGTWGTAKGLDQFPLQRMEIWQEVCAEFLPLTSDQVSED